MFELKGKNMKSYDETEQAYKNGYEAGVKELAERLKEKRRWDIDMPDYVFVSVIDSLAKELTEGKEDEGK